MFATWTLPAGWHRPASPEPRELWSRDDWARESSRLREGTRLLTGLVSEHLRELNQRLARLGYKRLRYIWVIEAHKSGVPHAHAIVVHRKIRDDLRAERKGGLTVGAEYCSGLPPGLWRDAAPPGLGRMDLSIARRETAVTSYLSKLAGEATKGQGRLSLGRGQRTYGASKGMLAPRRTRARDYTGVLVHASTGFLVGKAARGSERAAWLETVTIKATPDGLACHAGPASLARLSSDNVVELRPATPAPAPQPSWPTRKPGTPTRVYMLRTRC